MNSWSGKALPGKIFLKCGWMALIYSWDLVGHDKVLGSIETDIRDGNLAHAYLFAGPDHIGKFSAAKVMAHILQCESDFCRECAVCKEIDKGYHSDTLEIPNDGESIKIEKIRELIEKVNITKQGKYKILLIQNIERMTVESSNALLKTLEDPPENVIFILTTNRVKEVLATILSRVRLFKFRRLANDDLETFVRRYYPLTDENMMETVCAFAMGRPGKALSLLQDADLYESYRKMYIDIEMFLKKPDRAVQFAYVGDLVTSAKEAKDDQLIREFLDIFQLVLRKEMMMNMDGESGILSLEKSVKLLEKAHEAQELLKRNINTRLLLENMMLAI